MVQLDVSEMHAMEALEDLSKQAKKQKELIQYFIENSEPIEQAKLIQIMGTSSQTVKALVSKGIVKTFQQEVFRDPYKNQSIEQTEAFELTDEQAAAMDPIIASIDEKEDNVFLLHGVTGSGKTEIYLQSIQHVISKGQEAIVLVPEISLTPQMVAALKAALGQM